MFRTWGPFLESPGNFSLHVYRVCIKIKVSVILKNYQWTKQNCPHWALYSNVPVTCPVLNGSSWPPANLGGIGNLQNSCWRKALEETSTKWWFWSQAFPAETVETGNKNRFVTETMHILRRKLRFRAFPERVCQRILSLESVDYFGTSEHFGVEKK